MQNGTQFLFPILSFIYCSINDCTSISTKRARSQITNNKKTHYVCVSCFNSFFYLFSSFFALSYFKLEEWTLDFFPRCNFAAKSLKAHVNTRIDTVDGKCLPIRVFSVLFLFIRKERARTETIIGFEFIATSSSHILRTPYSCTRAR